MNGIDRQKTFQLLDTIRKGSASDEFEVAKSIHYLQQEFPDLEDDVAFCLSEKLHHTIRQCAQPFLNDELRDAVRRLLSESLDSPTYCMAPEDAQGILSDCPQEAFDYLVELTAHNNQSIYRSECPEIPTEVRAWMGYS